MTDYILDGWGDRAFWSLYNSHWDYSAPNWRIYHDDVGSYGEREVITYNTDWFFDIGYYVEISPTSARITDILIYLEGDSEPIIFRLAYGPGAGSYPRTYLIIYNSTIRDSVVVNSGDPSFNPRILRIGSVYTYLTRYNISFDYGTKKKAVKIILTNASCDWRTLWYNPVWYYTTNLNLLKGDAIIF